MKKYLLLLSIVLAMNTLSIGQEWLQNLPENKKENELSFFDYQNAFEEYWAPFNVVNGYYLEEGEKVKAAGWKQYKRWEWNMEGRMDPSTGAFPTKSAQQVYNEFVKANPDQGTNKSSNWTELGPGNSDGGYAGVGRLNCIAFHPSDNNTYWVGAPAGGLWVTTNNGSSWTCLTDDNDVLGVSDIAIPTNYSSSQTIFIATGDRDAFDNRSVGVLKSTNGGSTWNATGLQYTLAQGKMVTRLLMDPNNNSTIIASTNSGVYKTTNGGTTWSNQLTSRSFIDMEYKPGDYNTLYGSTTGGDIYLSTDGGNNWSQSFNQGNRVELAVSPDNSNYVYAVVANGSSALYGVYRSTNSGSSFSLVFDSYNLLGWASDGSGSSGQGWYDLAIAVSPNNANTLLVGGVNTWKSTNGGSTWSIANHWWGDGVPAVHADKHMLKYRSNGDLFECNDGGVYISTNDGTSWADKTNGIVISQMYKLGVSQTVANETITGLQDNGTKLLSANSWDDVKGGDGMECLIDYTDVNIQYGTYVNGQISRTTNHWGSSTAIEPSGAGSGAWVTPYIIDPVDHNTLYAGYADVWKTTNKGNSWTKISTMSTGSKIRSMAISESNNNTLYVADPNDIWKTTNGGSSWTNINGSLPLSQSSIKYIAVKSDDPNTLWLALSGYNSSNVYQSTNGGSTWTNISSGLPQLPCYTIVQNTQISGSVHLYVGTELGVYFKNGTDNWIEYNSGLPNVQCGELEIYYASNSNDSKLRLASYGRGLWESPLTQENSDLASVQTTAPINITMNSATLGGNVTDEGSTNVSERGVVWSLSPNPNTSDNKIVNSGTGTGSYIEPLSGLSSATTYYTKAYAINSTGTSYGSQESFTTNCASFNLPFSEDFESSTFPSNCWLVYRGTNNIGSSNDWVSSNDAQNGSQSAYIEYEDVSGGNAEDWLVSPEITLASGSELSFYQKQGYSTEYGSMYYVKVSTSSQTSQGSFTTLESWGESDFSTSYSEKIIDLSAYDGQSIYLAFIMTNDNGDDWYVDNINITASSAPTPVATVFSTPGCSTGSVTVTSNLSGSQTFYLTANDGTVLDNATANTTSHVFTGLSNGVYRGKVENSGQMSSLSSSTTLTNNTVPNQPSAISGEANPCENTTETYSVTNVSGVDYIWTLPSGWTGTSTSNSITVNIGSASGDITVTPSNTCGNGSSRSKAISVDNTPNQPSAISGEANPCENASETYSVTNVSGVDYTWMLPSGWTGTSTSNSITVTIGSTSGDIMVTPSNTCGNGSSRSKAITVDNTPDQPSAINGETNPCEGDSETYSVTNASGVDYTWTLPSGWTGSSTSNSITVTVGSSSGDISVSASNDCGNGSASLLGITVKTTPAQPSEITGNPSVCEGTQETYTVPTDANADSYVWTIPNGWSGTSTSNSIVVTVAANGGNITATPSNDCGTGIAQSLTVQVTNSGPPEPGEIQGDLTVCEGGTQTYLVPDDVSVDSYTWTLPSGWTGSSTSNSITVTVGSSNGTISVYPSNLCGDGPAQTADINVSTNAPDQASPIAGATEVCEGDSETYSVTLISGLEYTWQLPSGWSGASLSNEITVTVGPNSGDITVTPSNGCGGGPERNISVDVSNLPLEISGITGEENPCEGTNQTYTVENQPGFEFNWTLPTGWSGSSTSNSITVTVGSADGNITVNAENDCGDGPVTILAVDPTEVLGNLGNISGPATVMETLGATYSIDPTDDVTSYQWSLSSNWEIQSGLGSNEVYIFFPEGAESGVLRVSAENECGSSEMSVKNIEITPVGTKDLHASNIHIYPNPSHGYLSIELDQNLSEDAHIKVWSIDGKLVHQEVFSQGFQLLQLDLSNLAPGNYFIDLENQTIHHKFKIVITK